MLVVCFKSQKYEMKNSGVFPFFFLIHKYAINSKYSTVSNITTLFHKEIIKGGFARYAPTTLVCSFVWAK